MLRGRTCASAWSALLQEKDFTDHVKRGAFSASASVEPGLRPFHTARVSRAEQRQRRSGAYAEREQRVPIVLSLAASARARRCVQRTERNGGFGFQTKMKDRFLNQRR